MHPMVVQLQEDEYSPDIPNNNSNYRSPKLNSHCEYQIQ